MPTYLAAGHNTTVRLPDIRLISARSHGVSVSAVFSRPPAHRAVCLIPHRQYTSPAFVSVSLPVRLVQRISSAD